MTIIAEKRASDSPFVESITQGCTLQDGTSLRPAEISWHMVLVRWQNRTQLIVVGPWLTSGTVSWKAGAEILWIKFKLGTFMPHLSTRDYLNTEKPLPKTGKKSFWLNGSAWQFPDYENADTFVNRLVHDEVLVFDPLVGDVLQGRPHELSPRTVRHRFQQATGQTKNHIEQFQRAQRAVALLRQGVSIIDVAYEAGYYDQPHLTRSLKRFIGYTPTQFISQYQHTG